MDRMLGRSVLERIIWIHFRNLTQVSCQATQGDLLSCHWGQEEMELSTDIDGYKSSNGAIRAGSLFPRLGSMWLSSRIGSLCSNIAQS